MYPITINPEDNSQCQIPFNSGIKFNLIVRDMKNHPKNDGGEKTTIFLKGAPEKVLNRVSKILVKNEAGQLVEENFSEEISFETEAANSRFGLMGERVLAFARFEVDSQDYPKGYQYDTKDWAKWDGIYSQESQSKPAGWFPM